jgi:hypothetical protein
MEQHHRDAGDVVAQPVCGHVEAGGRSRAGGDGIFVTGIGSWARGQPGLDASLPGCIENDAIEPLVERHAATVRRLARNLERLSSDPSEVARKVGFHGPIRI